MDTWEQFVDVFRDRSENERKWLQEAHSFTHQHLCPLVSGPTRPAEDTGAGVCCETLARTLVGVVKENTFVSDYLPLSYRLVSVSQLLSRQPQACVSNLAWTIEQHRAWVREAEPWLPAHRALPRVHLLLAGCLEESQQGGWRLRDAGGTVRCECVSFSPLWRHRLVFLPHWNYIPKEDGGHVELVGAPVCLCPAPDRSPEPVGAAGVREAAGFLLNRSPGRRVSVWGRVASVCALLLIRGVAFFFFSLTDDVHTLPVLVMESSRLWWRECLCVGDRVCVTCLRVSVLAVWNSSSVLAVTDASELHTGYPQPPGQDTPPSPRLGACPAGSPQDTPPAAAPLPADEEPDPNAQSCSRTRWSRVIDYQGTVTEVVSAGAGLYVMDREVCLCLAYQPSLKRPLRVGDSVQVNHVHFLYRPSPDFPPCVLCTCLRSTLRLTAFSRLRGPPEDSGCPGDGALLRLLLEKNLGVSDYLWLCHLSAQLSRSLVPRVLRTCVCLLSWRLMVSVGKEDRRERRDIYREMLDEPHTCPLTQYCSEPQRPQLLGLSQLCRSLVSTCWSSSLRTLLPDDGAGLTSAELNARLSWSSSVQPGSSLRQRPLMLVGVLELPSSTSELSLQLRDGTAALDCVLTESSQGRGQAAVCNTAWIGCLVCVPEFSVVTERFIQSDFPSFQHLDQEKFITHKNSRVYLQFSLDHVHVLSPSVDMRTHLSQRGRGSEKTKERTGGQKKRKLEEEATGSASASTRPAAGRPCVSIVIRVEQKEGVAWRNVGGTGGQVGLVLSFSVTAAAMGPAVTWGQDPRNAPETETETRRQRKVSLVFSGTSARWFPVVQPGSSYRLVAAQSQDPCVLIGPAVSAQSGAELFASSTLQVKPDWRFYTLTESSELPVLTQAPSASLLSVSEVLESSRDLVSFQALVCDRISVNEDFSDPGDQNTGVCLTVCDQSGPSLRVYLDMKSRPYLLGLLPGNTLLFSEFQRRVSRAGSVYCRCLPVSLVAVVLLAGSSPAHPPNPPRMLLGPWARSPACAVAQVRGHVVRVLCVRLQWVCSLCGGLYPQVPAAPARLRPGPHGSVRVLTAPSGSSRLRLSQSGCSAACGSASAVFQSQAKLVLDDGSGEAHVWASGPQVRPLLGLSGSEWEELQRALRPRGLVEVWPRGQNLQRGCASPALAHLQEEQRAETPRGEALQSSRCRVRHQDAPAAAARLPGRPATFRLLVHSRTPRDRRPLVKFRFMREGPPDGNVGNGTDRSGATVVVSDKSPQ